MVRWTRVQTRQKQSRYHQTALHVILDIMGKSPDEKKNAKKSQNSIEAGKLCNLKKLGDQREKERAYHGMVVP